MADIAEAVTQRIFNWIDFFASTGPAVKPLVLYLMAFCLLAGGVLLLLWGRPLRRVLMALIAGGIGAAVGYYFSQYLKLPLWAPPVIGAAAGLLVGALLAPPLWAIAAAAGFASSASTLLLLSLYPRPREPFSAPLESGAGESLQVWGRELARMSWLALKTLAGEHPALFYPIVIGVGIVALVVFVLRMNWAVILMTASAGAKAVTTGVLMILLLIHPDLWPGLRQRFYIPLAAATALGIFGIVFQGLRLRKAGRKTSTKEPEEEREAPEESRSAKKGRKRKSENAE